MADDGGDAERDAKIVARVYDVFISYAHVDADRDVASAHRIAAWLQHLGYHVWWDRTLIAGQKWPTELKTKIERSARVIVLWSPQADISQWVGFETKLADIEDKLVPLVIEPHPTPETWASTHRVVLTSFEEQKQAILDLLKLQLPSPKSASTLERALDGALEVLSPSAGAELLGELGVWGSQEELEAVSDELEGHALSLSLLGTYLDAVYAGDVRKCDHLDFAPAVAGADERGQRGARRAQHVMARYVERFAEIEAARGDGGAELAILRMVGLFDRPAPKDALEELLREPAIAGLTDALHGIEPHKRAERWAWAIHRLRALGLLNSEDERDPGTLDANPVVREYFAAEVKATAPAAYAEAHGRLCDFFLARAAHRRWLYATTGDPAQLAGAEQDLADAEAVARRDEPDGGAMRLYLADIALERCRLCLAQLPAVLVEEPAETSAAPQDSEPARIEPDESTNQQVAAGVPQGETIDDWEDGLVERGMPADQAGAASPLEKIKPADAIAAEPKPLRRWDMWTWLEHDKVRAEAAAAERGIVAPSPDGNAQDPAYNAQTGASAYDAALAPEHRELIALADAHWRDAAQLIADTGYHRRDGERDELRRTLDRLAAV